MLVDQAAFLAAFPEFADSTLYPPAQISMWSVEGEREFGFAIYGDSQPLAIMLFIAHELSLGAIAARSAAVGQPVGAALSVISSKSVGSVSKSYDNSQTASSGAGEWNATSYGQRLYRLIRSFSAGPFYVPQTVIGASPYGAFPFCPR